MVIYIDIDETICNSPNKPNYTTSTPIKENIAKANKLYDEGHTIFYWTARGAASKIDHTDLTSSQLKEWGCLFHQLKMNSKPSYDLLICDKTKRIEEI